MAVLEETIDIAVIGAGHAGCEAALAAARMGLETVVFTVSVDSIAMMPCNPNIGGSSKGHLVRATLESVAYSLEHNLRVAAEAGAQVGELNAMGGASNSRLWTQIKADVTGKTIKVPTSDTASTLGAAILAGVGVGVYEGFEEAVDETIVITRVQEPDMEAHEQYKKYMQMYLDLSEALTPIFNKKY